MWWYLRQRAARETSSTLQNRVRDRVILFECDDDNRVRDRVWRYLRQSDRERDPYHTTRTHRAKVIMITPKYHHTPSRTLLYILEFVKECDYIWDRVTARETRLTLHTHRVRVIIITLKYHHTFSRTLLYSVILEFVREYDDIWDDMTETHRWETATCSWGLSFSHSNIIKLYHELYYTVLY